MCGNLILPAAIDYVYFYMKLNLRNLLYVIIGAFPDGQSALMLVCARLRHVAASEWGSKRYLNMNHLFDLELQRKVEDQSAVS